jgi:hypothetical protein
MAEESSTSRPRDEHGRLRPGESESEDDAGADERKGNDDVSEAFSGGRREKAGITAPSIGPNTIIDREPASERLARHDISHVDALGKEKRRSVVGHTYGPTFARQAALYGIFLAVVAAIAFGGKILIDKSDEPPNNVGSQALWSKPDAPQRPPKPLQ